MNIETIQSVYFVGTRDIGMNTLVRYSLSKGKVVVGHDRAPSELTQHLMEEGTQIRYEGNISLIPDTCEDPATILVVLTPAVPREHTELTHFRDNGFEIQKRAQVLDTITHSSKRLYVAGTRGKTTTPTMTAHLLRRSHIGCTAFLGGISRSYGTNLLLSSSSPYIVIEAGEFDRPFRWLSPYMSVITATDPDRLDIYGTEQAYLESFEHYTTLIQPGGALIIREDISLQPKAQEGAKIHTYSHDKGDFHTENTRIGNGEIFIDFIGPDIRIDSIQLGVPVSVNIENGIAAMTLAYLNGVTAEETKQGMASFRGMGHRFNFKIKNDQIVFLSDYAHHPSEIRQSVMSMRELYRDKEITAVFQPHLYTRTWDFYKDLADNLSLLDEVILVNIYPAREQPIPGVTSQLIYDNLHPGIKKSMYKRKEILDTLKTKHVEVLITLGTGDIDSYAPNIYELLTRRITPSDN